MACNTWCSYTGEIPTKGDPESRLDDWVVNVSDFSNLLTDGINKLVWGGGAESFTLPTQYWISCHSTLSTETGPGTELSGNNYGRMQVLLEKVTDRKWATSADVSSQSASADWDPILSLGVYDAQTGGRYLGYGTLSVPKIILTSQVFFIGQGNFTLEFLV